MEVIVIASSSIDGGIGCWDLKTGNERLRYKSCASPAAGLTAVGQKFLASSQLRNGSTSGSIFYWSWTKPQVEVKNFPVEPIKALVANTEGIYIVGGGSSGDIYLWEVNSGRLLKKWHGHYRAVTCLAFVGDDTMLVSGSQDGSIRVWSLISLFDDDFQRQRGTTQYLYDFNEHTMPVTDIVVDYGGCNALIVSASEDRTCKVWSLAKGTPLKTIVFPSAINAVALDPRGSVFFAGGRDGKIYIAPLSSLSNCGPQVLGSVSEQSKAVTCLAYATDGNLLLSGSEDGVVCVWNPESRNMIRTFLHGKGPVNNIQIVRKRISMNSYATNKTQSSWKSSSSSLPPPLEKYEKSEEDCDDNRVIVDHSSTSDNILHYPAYQITTEFLEAQAKEFQDQDSAAATEIKLDRLKLLYKKSLQLNQEWEKNYEHLVQVCVGEISGEEQSRF